MAECICRYVIRKCRDKADHVTKFGTIDLIKEYNLVTDNVTGATANCGDDQPYRCINVFDIFGNDTDLSFMVTTTGESIWGRGSYLAAGLRKRQGLLNTSHGKPREVTRQIRSLCAIFAFVK